MQANDPGAPAGKALTEQDVLMVVTRASELTGRVLYAIVGSGSMAPLPAAPPHVRFTIDIDLYPLDGAADLMDQQKERNLISDKMGPGTDFAEQESFYVQPVDSWTTAHLPSGWLDRTTVVETIGGVRAHCLAPVDLCLCKLGAGRPKDITHIANLLDAALVTEAEIQEEMLRVREKQPKLADKQGRTLEAARQFRSERIERGKPPSSRGLRI